jgi:hypothetical protein
VQRTRALHVHRLAAQANPQRWQLTAFRQCQHREVKILAIACHLFGLRVWRLTVQLRIQICAAGHEEAVEHFNHLLPRLNIMREGQQHGQPAGAQN